MFVLLFYWCTVLCYCDYSKTPAYMWCVSNQIPVSSPSIPWAITDADHSAVADLELLERTSSASRGGLCLRATGRMESSMSSSSLGRIKHSDLFQTHFRLVLEQITIQFLLLLLLVLASKKHFAGMLIDLFKAFDTVYHSVLQQRLTSIAFDGNACSWFCFPFLVCRPF